MNYLSIAGHEKIKGILKNAIKNKNVSHAYIFEGSNLIGKRSMAKVFAKTLLCKEQGIEPCEKCSACIQFDGENHPDFYQIKPSGNSFKKEQIEDLQKKIKNKPYEGIRQVYILEDSEKMTQEAQNSFLKTLEEPPSYAIIIMTTQNSRAMLPTIISRSQTIRFSPVSEKDIKSYLENEMKADEKEANLISKLSNGVVGDAIKILKSEEFKNMRNKLIELIDDTMYGTKMKCFDNYGFFEDYKDEIDDILKMMIVWFRDLMVYQETKDDSMVINSDKMISIKRQVESFDKMKFKSCIDIVLETQKNIVANMNKQLCIEVMLLKIQEG